MDTAHIVRHPATITTADGFDLAGQTYGDAESCRAGVLLVGAMGVDQEYYAAFAARLASQKFFVVTFDYRGMDDSRPLRYSESLRGFEADVSTWATRDVPAAVDFVAERIGGKPLLWLGHSLGGQILGQVPNRARIAAMITVATGSGIHVARQHRIDAWLLRRRTARDAAHRASRHRCVSHRSFWFFPPPSRRTPVAAGGHVVGRFAN